MYTKYFLNDLNILNIFSTPNCYLKIFKYFKYNFDKSVLTVWGWGEGQIPGHCWNPRPLGSQYIETNEDVY